MSNVLERYLGGNQTRRFTDSDGFTWEYKPIMGEQEVEIWGGVRILGAADGKDQTAERAAAVAKKRENIYRLCVNGLVEEGSGLVMPLPFESVRRKSLFELTEHILEDDPVSGAKAEAAGRLLPKP